MREKPLLAYFEKINAFFPEIFVEREFFSAKSNFTGNKSSLDKVTVMMLFHEKKTAKSFCYERGLKTRVAVRYFTPQFWAKSRVRWYIRMIC